VRRVRAAVWPNPGRGPARIELFLGGDGGALDAHAGLYDVQGRAVVTFHRGALARGLTLRAWDGRGDDGQPLPGGLYFLRLSSPLGSAVTRVIRLR